MSYRLFQCAWLWPKISETRLQVGVISSSSKIYTLTITVAARNAKMGADMVHIVKDYNFDSYLSSGTKYFRVVF